MRRKLSWMLPIMLVFSVYAEDEKEVVVENAKELKEIKVKQITWKKDPRCYGFLLVVLG